MWNTCLWQTPGAEMTYTIFCLLVSTFPPQNIAYSLKSKSKLWIPIPLISKDFKENFSPKFLRISLTVKRMRISPLQIYSKLTKEKSSNIIKEGVLEQMALRGASSVSQEGHWLCFPALLSCWLGAAHRKHGSMRHAVEFSGAGTLSQLYFLKTWRSVNLWPPSMQGFGG